MNKKKAYFLKLKNKGYIVLQNRIKGINNYS